MGHVAYRLHCFQGPAPQFGGARYVTLALPTRLFAGGTSCTKPPHRPRDHVPLG
jgi:hypothetical protein